MTALITGASGGIGLEIARIAAAEGHDLVLVARSAAKLQSLAAELEQAHPVKTLVIATDFAASGAAAEVLGRVASAGFTVDILVNNAGFGLFGPFVETSLATEHEMLQLNIVTLTELTKLVLPGMVTRRQGRIMNVASTAAFFPGPLMAVYYATKGYVLLFSEAIANELKGSGVTVTALCPGPTESGFLSAASLEDSKLFAGKALPTSADVARYAWHEMMEGTPVAIHGFMNRLTAALPRFLPRTLVAQMVRNAQERKS